MPILSSLGALKNFNVKAYSGTGNIGYYTTNAQFLNDCTDGTYIYISGTDPAGNFTLRLTETDILNRQYNTTTGAGTTPLDTVIRNGILYRFDTRTVSVSNRSTNTIIYPNPNTSSNATTTMTTYTNYALTHITPYQTGATAIFYGSGIRENATELKPTFFRIGGTVWYRNITELGDYVVTGCSVSSTPEIFYSIYSSTGGYLGHNFMFNSSGTLTYQADITADNSISGIENVIILKSTFDNSNNLYCLGYGVDTSTPYLIKLDSTLTVLWCKQITTTVVSNVTLDSMKLYVDSSYVYIIPGVDQDVSGTDKMRFSLIKLDKALLDGSSNPVVWANLISMPLGNQLIKNALYAINDRVCILTITNPSSSPITSAVLSLPTDGNIPYRGAFNTPYDFEIARTTVIMETIIGFSTPTTYTTTTDTAFTSTLNTPIQAASTLVWNNVSFGS